MAADRGSGFGWFLIGLGIGAAVGVLYAPKAGHETREDLAATSEQANHAAAPERSFLPFEAKQGRSSGSLWPALPK